MPSAAALRIRHRLTACVSEQSPHYGDGLHMNTPGVAETVPDLEDLMREHQASFAVTDSCMCAVDGARAYGYGC